MCGKEERRRKMAEKSMRAPVEVVVEWAMEVPQY